AFVSLLLAVPVTQLAMELAHGDRPQCLDLFSRMPSQSNRMAFASDLRGQCGPAKIIRPWTQWLRFVTLAETPGKTLMGRDGWLFYQPSLQYLVETQSASEHPTQDEILLAVTDFRDQLQAQGIHLLVMIAPNKASIYPDKLNPGTMTGSINPRTLDLMARLQQADIELVDLFSIFQEARRTATSGAGDYYLAQDSHWSPAGMDLAARTVADRLGGILGWVKKQDPTYKLKPTPVTRHGDIIAMMQVPQIQRSFEPESLACTQIAEADTQALYHDDPNSPVLVMGDSFLRIYSRDEPGSAGFVEHLAYHMGRPLTSLVNDGGASTLVRQQLASRPQWLAYKTVVIWEFVERDIRFGTEGWQVVPLPKLN
ncbi:MAG: hypothetical protein K9N55_19750, partial [Phycisphaerae bacterium]|nr:hypothetical protein [Phycisphaerae bacterium]